MSSLEQCFDWAKGAHSAIIRDRVCLHQNPRYFLTAIKLVEKHYAEYDTAYADLAELLLETGDYKREFDAAANAANRNPTSARNFYLGAKALEQLGKLDVCLNWLQRR